MPPRFGPVAKKCLHLEDVVRKIKTSRPKCKIATNSSQLSLWRWNRDQLIHSYVTLCPKREYKKVLASKQWATIYSPLVARVLQFFTINSWCLIETKDD